MAKITIKDTGDTIISVNENDYISLPDIAKYKMWCPDCSYWELAHLIEIQLNILESGRVYIARILKDCLTRFRPSQLWKLVMLVSRPFRHYTCRRHGYTEERRGHTYDNRRKRTIRSGERTIVRHLRPDARRTRFYHLCFRPVFYRRKWRRTSQHCLSRHQYGGFQCDNVLSYHIRPSKSGAHRHTRYLWLERNTKETPSCFIRLFDRFIVTLPPLITIICSIFQISILRQLSTTSEPLLLQSVVSD